MIIYLKNKHTLQVDDFTFKCSIGSLGKTKKKREGDKKTPIGIFELDKLFIREDRIKKISSNLETINIKKNMGWCDDVDSRYYNKRIKINKYSRCEKLYRKDYKYNYLIPIKYNWRRTKKAKGSAIFLHLTKNYKPTKGCVALKEKDFLILCKLMKKNTKIKIT